jgi:hypothetical protein
MSGLPAGWPLTALFSRLRGGGGALAVEQVLALDGRRRLCIVRCEQRRVLLLVGGNQDLVVGWLDPTAGDPSVRDLAAP